MKHKIKNLFYYFRPRYKTVMLDELPEEYDKHTIYRIGEGPYLWSVVMKCPCGCGEIIQLNMEPDEHPFWRYRNSNNKISLSPSIWRKSGCKSHFYVTKGKIKWCG